MKGQIIIPRGEGDFVVAHRIDSGEHHFEVSVGSSFNELYWDFPAKRFVADPERYSDLSEILKTHGAGWLLSLIPNLAEGSVNLSSNGVRDLALNSRLNG